MKTLFRHRSSASRKGGYTLIEVTIAGSLLALGIAAAASLSITASTQEEINYRAARALNLQENYVKAYHLGIDPALIEVIMPPEAALSTVNTTTSTPFVTNVGTMESVTWEFQIQPNSADAGTIRTVNARAFRSPTY